MYLLKLISFLAVSEGFAKGSQNTLFYRHRGKYLSNSVIRTKLGKTELECAVHCSRDEGCVSVNYKTTGKKRGLCELNNKTLSKPFTVNKKEFNNLEILQKPPEKKPTPPSSCKDILIRSPGTASGLYEISVDNKMVTVYCEMVLHGGGFTFIPKSAVRKGILPNLVSQLFTSRNEVLLYIQKKDESQTYTLIQQLAQKSHTPLVVLQNTHTEEANTYEEPENSKLSDYLYLSTSLNINGFISNSVAVKYNFGGPYPTKSYFAFFPNHRGEDLSTYFADDLVYETTGVSVDWRKTGIISTENLPTNFFFLTEMHYGGNGCYTSSDRWAEANGTAIGLR